MPSTAHPPIPEGWTREPVVVLLRTVRPPDDDHALSSSEILSGLPPGAFAAVNGTTYIESMQQIAVDVPDGDIAEAIADAFNAGWGGADTPGRDVARRVWLTHRFLRASGMSSEHPDFGERAIVPVLGEALTRRVGFHATEISVSTEHLYVVNVHGATAAGGPHLVATVHLNLAAGVAVWGADFEHTCTLALGADYVADAIARTVL